ncbi:hypothetical protein AB0K48_14625 [Nonomuraea sp. NPDC055795]
MGTVSGIAPLLPAWVRLGSVRQAVGDRARRRESWTAPETVTFGRDKHGRSLCRLAADGDLSGWEEECRELRQVLDRHGIALPWTRASGCDPPHNYGGRDERHQ